MYKFALLFCVLGVFMFATPVLSPADSRNWSQGQNLLEEHLQPGQTPAAYRRILRDLGYTITSVNYSTPDYVEYEVVKGDRSYEVQMDLDEDTGRATSIDIANNLWETSRTEAALEQSDRSEQMTSLNNPEYILVITPVYVEAGRARTQMGRMVQELENLPLGRDHSYYRRALKQQGYQIKDTATKGDRMQISAEKNGMNVLLNIRFDQDTDESTQLSAFPLLVNVGQDMASQKMKSQQKVRSQQASSGIGQTVQELESLPVGKAQGFYRNALRQRGFQILDTFTTGNETQFEAEKDGQRIALNIMFDDQGKSTEVEANRLSRQQERPSQLPQQQSSQTSQTKQSKQNEQIAGIE